MVVATEEEQIQGSFAALRMTASGFWGCVRGRRILYRGCLNLLYLCRGGAGGGGAGLVM